MTNRVNGDSVKTKAPKQEQLETQEQKPMTHVMLPIDLFQKILRLVSRTPLPHEESDPILKELIQCPGVNSTQVPQG